MRAYQEYSERIREAGRRLLSEKKVDVIIGFRKGTVPFMNEPVLIKQADQAHQLYWDGNCGINLANYLPRRPDRIAIDAKGCDSRNTVVHILENQIQRDQLTILGAPCHGMLDRKRILAELNGSTCRTWIARGDSTRRCSQPRCGASRRADLEMWAFPQAMDRTGCAGTLVKAPGVPSGGNGTPVYFGCDDCAIEASRVSGAGGKLQRDKMSIGQYGFVALACDTEGDMIGMHSVK